jgi:hypothetical protein
MAQRRKNGLKEDSRSKGEGRRKLRSESLEERILLSATWVDTDTDAADDAGGEGAPDPGGADAAAELDAAMSGTDDLFGDGEPGADGGGATVLEGGEGEDSFVIAGAGDGEVFQVRGGGGADRVDLSSYDSSSASFEDGAVVMETGDGGSFRVEYEGVEGFAFGDADAHVLSGDASGEVAGGTAILVDGSSTATVGVEGAGQALWSYDASTGGVSIDGVSGTDGGTTLRLDAASDSPLAIRSVGVGGDLGAVESAGDVGELTIASDADVREITVGGGEGEIGVV